MNHNEFDEILINISLLIFELDQDHENVHKVTSMLQEHDLEYHMDLIEQSHKDQGHLHVF